MPISGDPRRRTIALLAGGALAALALLGALNAFNTSSIHFLNPDTSGETLAFTSVIILVFLVLLAFLLLLLRTIVKLYADQSSSADPRGLHVPVQLSAYESVH